MSICSNTILALSHCRPPSKTLLPFLYQTATIQQVRTLMRPTPRLHITSQSKGSDDIPFEDEELPRAIDTALVRGTTITGAERAAFKKLYKTFDAQGHLKLGRVHPAERGRITNEYYADNKYSLPPSLNKVFDEVLKGGSRPQGFRGSPRADWKVQEPEQVATGDVANVGLQQAHSRRNDAKAAAAKLRQLKILERERIDKLLQDAQTDKELWQTLDREVFKRIRELDLDGCTTQRHAPKVQSQTEPTASDSRIVFHNYPYHLITAVHTLETVFPSSPLVLSVLPTIKGLGRSSYALGATTFLYQHLIRIAWVQQSSYSYIDSLLVDMNNCAIEFDSDILALLESVIKENEMARSGRFGRDMQMVYGMEQFVEDIEKIRRWRTVIAEKLGVAQRMPL